MKTILIVLAFAGMFTRCAVVAHASPINFLVNGNFGAGNTKVPFGWTATNNRYESVAGGPSYYMGNGFGDGTTYLSQTFADVAGKIYNLTFTFFSTDANQNYFSASVDGGVLFSGTNIAGGTSTEDLTFIGAGSDTLTFASYAGGYFTLSNVAVIESVPPMPEPGTLMLFGTGLAAIATATRRRRRKA